MRINSNQYSLNIHPNGNVTCSNDKLTFGEFFAGGGGCTEAAKKSENLDIRWLLNHDKIACKVNSFHNPYAKVYWTDIYMQDEHELEPVDIIQASFECDFQGSACGSLEIDVKSYMMGWELYRYIKHLLPMLLMVENVPGVKNWGPLLDGKKDKSRKGEEFEKWKKAICDLGYEYTESIRCAADDGLATIRTRYFAIFHKTGIDISWPEYTHNEKGVNGKLPWVPCKGFINLDNHGQSIFGRKFNENLPKQHRKPVSPNTKRRLIGGTKKYAPTFNQFISTYYGGEAGKDRGQTLEKPLATQTCENRHQLVTIEKMQFIQDYCHTDSFQLPEEPLYTQLTRQTKQLVTIEQCIAQYYGTDQTQSIDKPLNTIPCVDRHQLITLEKIQFISHYYNSGNNPESNNQSIEKPLHTIMSNNKAQLVTLLEDFDVKIRFLDQHELAAISTFPKNYFNQEGLKVSGKDAIRMIGNAVPPEWFFKILNHNIPALLDYKQNLISA